MEQQQEIPRQVAEVPEQEVVTIQKSDMEIQYYDMSKKKYLIILNHRYYEKRYGYTPTERRGTESDVENLTSTFEALGYKVTIENNKRREDIIKIITDLTNKDHSETSCIALAIMTHGNEDGLLQAYDCSYKLNDIIEILEKIATIPKLLFIQACRGQEMDKGHQVIPDGSIKKLAEYVVINIDFLVLYSTIEGYMSFRHTKSGSWMMQSLCKIIQEHHSKLDILQIITLVTKQVAYKKIVDNEDTSLNAKKQSLEARHTLTKILNL